MAKIDRHALEDAQLRVEERIGGYLLEVDGIGLDPEGARHCASDILELVLRELYEEEFAQLREIMVGR